MNEAGKKQEQGPNREDVCCQIVRTLAEIGNRKAETTRECLQKETASAIGKKGNELRLVIQDLKLPLRQSTYVDSSV